MPSSACDWSSDVCSSDRSEEHTSELQSRSDLVCRLLLEKKNNDTDVRQRQKIAPYELLRVRAGGSRVRVLRDAPTRLTAMIKMRRRMVMQRDVAEGA